MKSFAEFLRRVRFLAATATLATLSITTNSYAWDGISQGRITSLEGVAGSGGAPGNGDLRIYLEATPTVCPATYGYFATIESNDVNFKGIMAMLLLAYSMNKTVTIYTTIVGPFCQIGYIGFN